MRYVQVQTTFEKQEEAKKMAELLVNEKLAACVQIMPIRSIYIWKGETKNANEFLCLIKTKQSLMSELVKFIKSNHSYEMPEIIATEIIHGSDNYLYWISEGTR